jgi:hypothetical protein
MDWLYLRVDLIWYCLCIDTGRGCRNDTIGDAADKNFGFIDKENATDYEYDANCNMIRDHNKGLIIEYNILNLSQLSRI